MSLYSEGKYRFITEEGQFTLTHAEYEQSQLRKLFTDRARQTLFLGRTLVSYSSQYLSQNKDKAHLFAELQHEQNLNPLQFFAPSGQGALDFLNDRTSIVCFLTSGNRNGKTTTMIAKRLFMLIPCDKDWPCFTEHGVNFVPFRKPATVGLASYEWNNHKKTLVPEVFKWCPKAELDGFGTDQKSVNYRENPIIELKCGSAIHLYAYNQDQAAYESEALIGWDWDEQPPSEKWDGANERLRTLRLQGAQHNHSLTPHRLPGRPDTGAGSFLHRMYAGDDLRGYPPDAIQRYSITFEDVPDWIKPMEAKREAFNQWITEPQRRNDRKRLREGKARIYGLFHESSGLIYENWDSSVHVIDPFSIPSSATLFRAVDHGRVNPCGGLWGAVIKPGLKVTLNSQKTITWPDGPPILVLYKEYYKPGTVEENSLGIIEASGNLRMLTGTRRGTPAYTEIFQRERYAASVGDARSLGKIQEDSKDTLKHVYESAGLKLVPGSAVLPIRAIPMVERWFEIDDTKTHPIYGTQGMPRILVFATLRNFITEIQQYVWEENLTRRGDQQNWKETPRKHNDHLMSCLQLMVQIPPRYIDQTLVTLRSSLDKKRKDMQPALNVDPITGY